MGTPTGARVFPECILYSGLRPLEDSHWSIIHPGDDPTAQLTFAIFTS
jgi:hypothetical protein